jgi:hypothetical protein
VKRKIEIPEYGWRIRNNAYDALALMIDDLERINRHGIEMTGKSDDMQLAILRLTEARLLIRRNR